MKTTAKFVKRSLSLLLVLTMLLGLVITGAYAAASKVEGAVLYTVNDQNQLEYNVVYKAGVDANTTVTDKSGHGIETLDQLKTMMGKADAPKVELNVSTGERTLGAVVLADLTIDGDKVTEITVTKVSKRPVIGISWKKDDIGTDYQGFAEAFERNGAYAVYLPQVKSADEAKDVLSKLDGIFFTGGEDWNPALYNEEAYTHGSAGWNDARDTSDLNLMKKAVEMDVPLFAVCRGEQGFNVAMGGGLIQDVPTYLGQKVKAGEIAEDRVTVLEDLVYQTVDGERKQVPCEKDGAPHYRVVVDGLVHSGGTGYHLLDAGKDGIGVSKDSKWLYDILGTESVEFVATAHHQSVNPEKLAPGMTVAAISSDGIIEAIEYQSASFALAVQWHPERDALKDTRDTDVDQDLCNALLRALVEHATSDEAVPPVETKPETPEKPDGTKPETPDVPADHPFLKVESSRWYYNALQYVMNNGLFTGVPTTECNPDSTFTRAMIAQVLYNAAGAPEVTTSAGFQDVAADAWYADAVNWVAANKVMSGYNAETFGAADNVTRQQMAVTLRQYANLKEQLKDGTADLSTFTDGDKVATWAAEAMQWALGNGLLSGKGEGILDPSGVAKQSEAAALMMNFCEKIAEK